MRKSDFNYLLPEALIAQSPLDRRDASRLLVLADGEQLIDSHFSALSEFLRPNDLVVLNDTKVIAARLFAQKQTGGKSELLIERVIDDNHVLAFVRGSSRLKPGQVLLVDDSQVILQQREGMHWRIESIDVTWRQLIKQYGHMPLPPYIKRDDAEFDAERYQTVFAEKEGAVAAPTAGLHFTNEFLVSLKEQGIKFASVTLHVGSGTFQPMKVDELDQHVMHKEWLSVSKQTCEAIAECKASGGRVVAIGTTVVRALESAAVAGTLLEYAGETNLFITPGYQFNVVDSIFTNFHMPESTLLMLICAFAGYDYTMSAYRHAIEQEYRFFSYGDAMFIESMSD